jgi:hypothetical protein
MDFRVADDGYVLETGHTVPGSPDELWGNEAIGPAYLGGHARPVLRKHDPEQRSSETVMLR